MEKNLLQKRILAKIGYVGFPEEIIEQTLLGLQKDSQMKEEVKFLTIYYNSEKIFDPEFVIKAREKKLFCICILVQKLVTKYTIEAIECLIFHQFLRALSIDQEKNLSWYEANTKNAFKVVPSVSLKKSEAQMWQFLLSTPLSNSCKNRYRHLLTIAILFFDYISDYESLSLFIDKLEAEKIILIEKNYEPKSTRASMESAG